MGTRTAVAAIALALFVGSAWAGPKEDIQKKTKEAMENYDLMDYAASKKSLEAALAAAKKAKLDKDPSRRRLPVARHRRVRRRRSGRRKGAFAAAVAIDHKIQIEGTKCRADKLPRTKYAAPPRSRLSTANECVG